MARRIYNRYDRYIEKLTTYFKKIDEIEQQMDAEVQELSNIDKELSDYMHMIEDDVPIRNPKTFLQRVANARKRRREIKIITAVLHKWRQLSLKMNNKENRSMLLAELHKEVKQQQHDYKYRIIDKEELS